MSGAVVDGEPVDRPDGHGEGRAPDCKDRLWSIMGPLA